MWSHLVIVLLFVFVAAEHVEVSALGEIVTDSNSTLPKIVKAFAGETLAFVCVYTNFYLRLTGDAMEWPWLRCD
jgi:hypothetical protein